MAWKRIEMDSYDIWYWSGRTPECSVHCFKGDNVVARLDFFAGTRGPNISSSWGPSINYALSSFGDIIGILRQESPLVVWFNSDTLVGILSTSEHEPVGEQEI